jgi:hypothetical protein
MLFVSDSGKQYGFSRSMISRVRELALPPSATFTGAHEIKQVGQREQLLLGLTK